MTECPKCGGHVAEDAATCAACGATLGSARPPAQSGSVLGIVHSWSAAAAPQQKLVLVGSGLAVLGSFLPFYVMSLPEGMGGGSMAFLHTGFPGVVALLAAVALGLIGIMPSPSRQVTLVGFGLATLVLGMLVYASTASGFEPMNAAAAAGVLSHGIGFYVIVIGALVLEYSYAQRVAH